MTASVPEFTNLTFSAPGTALVILEASSASKREVRPKLDPSESASDAAPTTEGKRCPRMKTPQERQKSR